MTIDQAVTGLIYLVAVIVLFLVGKLVYDAIHRGYSLRRELLENDNLALALTVAGYYMGLLLALGGVLSGPSMGWKEDLIDIALYGLLAIVLINISAWLNDKIILRTFSNEKEIIQDGNCGTGCIEAANHIANGMILSGALAGEGDMVTALAFWIMGQAILVFGGLVYNLITPFDIHEEIEKDNVAVGVAFAGVLVALGNVVRVGVDGDFVSWSENLTQLGAFVAFGLVLLPVVRWATDRVLLPGAKLTDELVNQEKPNIGAGTIEAFSYIAASFLVGWVV